MTGAAMTGPANPPKTTPAADRDARFWDKLARRYAAKPVPDAAVYRRKLDLTQALFTPEMKVLEFGCGTGSTALEHVPHVAHVRATDFSPEMIAIAREKAEAAGIDNVDFAVEGVDQMDAPDASYDVVLGLSILHLLKDRDAAIAKVFRMLKPGGAFVSSTACLGDKLWIFKLLGPIGRALGLLPVLGVFTSRDLVAAMRRASFEIEHEWAPGGTQGLFLIAWKPG